MNNRWARLRPYPSLIDLYRFARGTPTWPGPSRATSTGCARRRLSLAGATAIAGMRTSAVRLVDKRGPSRRRRVTSARPTQCAPPDAHARRSGDGADADRCPIREPRCPTLICFARATLIDRRRRRFPAARATSAPISKCRLLFTCRWTDASSASSATLRTWNTPAATWRSPSAATACASAR